MSVPDVKLEIAFGADALDDPDPGDWTDVTEYLVDFDGGPSGRQNDLDDVEAGTMTFGLINTDGRFDPANPDSPYYPNVDINSQVRFTTATGTPLFRGYANGWPQTYDSNGFRASVALSCTDAMKILANADLPGSLFAHQIRTWETQLKAWWRFGEVDGASYVTDVSENHYIGRVFGHPDFRQPGLLLRDGEENGAIRFTERTAIYPPPASGVVGPEFLIEFLIARDGSVPAVETIYEQVAGDSYVRIAQTTSGVIQFTVVVGGLLFVTQTTLAVNDGLEHHIACRRAWNGATGTIKIYVNAVERSSTAMNNGTACITNGATITIGNSTQPTATSHFGGVLDELVIVQGATVAGDVTIDWAAALQPGAGDPVSLAVVTALDAVGWPAALRTIETSVSETQPYSFAGSALEFLRRLALTEGGLFWVATDGSVQFRNRDFVWTPPDNEPILTFGYGVDEVPFADLESTLDETNLYTQARVGREGGSTFTVDDGYSQRMHGVRTFSATDLLNNIDTESQDHANYIVHARKDPRPEFRSLTVNLADDRVPVDVLGLEPSQSLVTVRYTPRVGADVVERQGRIEEIRHEGSPGKRWTVTFRLSPWDPAVDQPWLLGDSTYGVLGSTTRLGW